MEFVSIRFFVYICSVKLIYMGNKDFDIVKNGVLTKYRGIQSQVVIPNEVSKIGDQAFRVCTDLTNIVIPNSVTLIGHSAFSWCKSLTSINIPNSVTRIGNFAFYHCDNLTNITIPSSVTSIGSCAFTDIKDVIPQYNANGFLRAFKAFNKDWTCMHDFQYEVGKSYHQDRNIIACKNGFHACTNPLNVFNYYHGEISGLHFAEVELSGIINFGNRGKIVVASDIKIVRELTVQDLCEIYNSMKKEK